jgi:hypothetical protein
VSVARYREERYPQVEERKSVVTDLLITVYSLSRMVCLCATPTRPSRLLAPGFWLLTPLPNGPPSLILRLWLLQLPPFKPRAQDVAPR